MVKRFTVFVSVLLACFPLLAWAHPGHGQHDGLLAGVLHSLTGVDHVLFMSGVGLMIALRAPALGFRVLALILLVQATASVSMIWPIVSPLWEMAIGMTLVALGLLMWRPQFSVATLCTAVLGAGLHAAAHWAVMPANAPVVAYGLGVSAVSALLFGVGYVSGRAMHSHAERAARIFGFSLTGGGIWWLLFS